MAKAKKAGVGTMGKWKMSNRGFNLEVQQRLKEQCSSFAFFLFC